MKTYKHHNRYDDRYFIRPLKINFVTHEKQRIIA
jgi:hypothetical protein